MNLDLAALAVGQVAEPPLVGQMPERAVDQRRIDPERSTVKADIGGKALADHLKPDHQVGDHVRVGLLADARGDAPGQEFGVVLDVGDEVEHLLGPEWHHAGLFDHRHGLQAAFDCRAARRRSKSSPAW